MPNPHTIHSDKALAAVKQNGDALRYVKDDALYDKLSK